MIAANGEAFAEVNLAPLAIEQRFETTGFSEVYHATSELNDGSFVVKIARQRLIAKLALATETELTPSIGSSHVLPILGSGTLSSPNTGRNGLPYVVTPYASGGTLKNYKVLDQDSAATALAIVKDAARGVRDIHAHGYVHSDVKADNIFIDDKKRGFIGDLGFAVPAGHIRDEVYPQLTGTVFGTPGYMSPEQMIGLPLTDRTDVFSLGVTAFYVLTRRFPWKGLGKSDSTVQLPLIDMYRTVRDQKPAKGLPGYVPLDTRDILYRCLDPDYRARPHISYLTEMPTRNPRSRRVARRVLAAQMK